MKGFDLKSYAAEPQFVKEIGHSVKKVRHDRCLTVLQAAGQECRHELMGLSAQEQLCTARAVFVGCLRLWLASNACGHAVRVLHAVTHGFLWISAVARMPLQTVFSELAPGLKNDYHPCPNTQFVVCIKGSW